MSYLGVFPCPLQPFPWVVIGSLDQLRELNLKFCKERIKVGSKGMSIKVRDRHQREPVRIMLIIRVSDHDSTVLLNVLKEIQNRKYVIKPTQPNGRVVGFYGELMGIEFPHMRNRYYTKKLPLLGEDGSVVEAELLSLNQSACINSADSKYEAFFFGSRNALQVNDTGHSLHCLPPITAC